VIKLRHYIRKEGKRVQEGVYTVYLLPGQQVHRAEVTDISDIADIIDISDIIDITSGYHKYCGYCGYCSIVISLWLLSQWKRVVVCKVL